MQTICGLPVGSPLPPALHMRKLHQCTLSPRSLRENCILASSGWPRCTPTAWLCVCDSRRHVDSIEYIRLLRMPVRKWQDQMKKTILMDGLTLPLLASGSMRSFKECRRLPNELRIQKTAAISARMEFHLESCTLCSVTCLQLCHRMTLSA